MLSHFLFSLFLFVAGILTFPFRIVFTFFFIDHPDLFRSKNNPIKHKKKVERIQSQVRTWNINGRQGLLVSSRPSWQKLTITDVNKSKLNRIDVDLGDIVSIDEKKQILTVEPRMKMGTLTRKLLPLGWTIPVVPELEELTVGGLICGGGIETSSHKYGGFYNTCLSYEVVLADGRCVKCSKTENSDLFFGIPMSYGTLGFLTAVEIPLIPAKKYVKLQYVPATNVDTAMELLEETKHEFVEGLQFAKNKFVIMYGDFVDFAPKDKIKTFSNWWDSLFHFDVERFLNCPSGQVQYIPTRDYYHRYTRAYFWIFAQILSLHKYGLFRIVFGWILPVNFALIKYILGIITFGKAGDFILWGFKSVNYVAQDYLVPIEGTPKLLNMVDQDIGVYPIWLCPITFWEYNGNVMPCKETATLGKPKLAIDIGVYGYTTKNVKDLSKLWKKYEEYTLEQKGAIGFYSETFLSREQFNEMFDPTVYNRARQTYGCDGAFPLVYDKISQNARTA